MTTIVFVNVAGKYVDGEEDPKFIGEEHSDVLKAIEDFKQSSDYHFNKIEVSIKGGAYIGEFIPELEDE